jgi:Arc/MetJ-type ribon-helix-helix transcriptional regulator
MEPKTLVGVRLADRDVELLDSLVTTWNLETRSDVLRELIRLAPRLMPSGEKPPELATNLRTALERMVENGWVPDVTSALTLAIIRGFSALDEDYARLEQSGRTQAQNIAREREARRKAATAGDRILRGTE